MQRRRAARIGVAAGLVGGRARARRLVRRSCCPSSRACGGRTRRRARRACARRAARAQPAVLRIVEVAVLAAALGDRVERDEAHARARARRRSSWRCRARPCSSRRGVAREAVRVAAAARHQRAVLGLGDDPPVRIRRHAARRPRAATTMNAGSLNWRNSALSSRPANAPGRSAAFGNTFRQPVAIDAEEVGARPARCPGSGRRGCRARCTTARRRPGGVERRLGALHQARDSAGTRRTARRSAPPRRDPSSRRSGRRGAPRQSS